MPILRTLAPRKNPTLCNPGHQDNNRDIDNGDSSSISNPLAGVHEHVLQGKNVYNRNTFQSPSHLLFGVPNIGVATGARFNELRETTA